MQAAIRVILVAMLALTLASCGSTKFRKYRGPAVTLVVVDKSERNMWLLHNDEVLNWLGYSKEEQIQLRAAGAM